MWGVELAVIVLDLRGILDHSLSVHNINHLVLFVRKLLFTQSGPTPVT
jgi:hypothetical protein